MYHIYEIIIFFNSPIVGLEFVPLLTVSVGIYTSVRICRGVTTALLALEGPGLGGGDVPVAGTRRYCLWTRITVGKNMGKASASTEPKPGRTNTANPFLLRLRLWLLLSILLRWASLSGTGLYSQLIYQPQMHRRLLSTVITYFLSEDLGNLKSII